MPSPLHDANELLDKVLETVWNDFGEFSPVLSEADRQRFIAEEEGLRERLKDTEKPESNSWLMPSFLTGWRSSQVGKAEKYLEEARDLRGRVRDEINEETRKRAAGRGIPPTSFINFKGIGTPKDTRSPLENEWSGSNEPAFLNGHGSGIDPPRHIDGWPASPPFEGTLHPPAHSFSPPQIALGPVFPTAEDANRFASATAGQQPVWQESIRNDEPVTMTNCVSINGSNANGVTLNNGGTENSGSVIHVTMAPSSPQHASHM